MNETDSALVNEPHKIIQVLGFFKLMTGSGKIEKRNKTWAAPWQPSHRQLHGDGSQ